MAPLKTARPLAPRTGPHERGTWANDLAGRSRTPSRRPWLCLRRFHNQNSLFNQLFDWQALSPFCNGTPTGHFIAWKPPGGSRAAARSL